MKKFYFSFAVLSILFVLGCQDNSIIDPVLPENLDKDQISGGTIIQGTIPLEGLLDVHGLNNTFYFIYGNVDYLHELVLVDPIPPAPQYYVELELNINASLSNPDTQNENNLTISGQSTDIFYVSEEGIYLLEKSFPVQGVSNGMVLVCRFLVTTDGVGLNEMWLEVANDIRHN